jgi:hypothetical protein
MRSIKLFHCVLIIIHCEPVSQAQSDTAYTLLVGTFAIEENPMVYMYAGSIQKAGISTSTTGNGTGQCILACR